MLHLSNCEMLDTGEKNIVDPSITEFCSSLNELYLTYFSLSVKIKEKKKSQKKKQIYGDIGP